MITIPIIVLLDSCSDWLTLYLVWWAWYNSKGPGMSNKDWIVGLHFNWNAMFMDRS